MVVRSDLAVGTELFDPALRGGEDVDLVWRLARAGWDVRYVPTSAVAHHGAATFQAFLRRQAFYGSTAAPLARRHPGNVAPAQFSAWSLAVWFLLLARQPQLALTALLASVAVLARRLRGLVRDPVAVAARIAGGGTARAALPSLSGLVRVWSPALLVGLACRRTRRAAALALLLPALEDWRSSSRELDPARFAAFHVADDAAYGIGVWIGCVRERTVEPLLPHVSWHARIWSPKALRRDLGRRDPAGSRMGGAQYESGAPSPAT